MGGKCIYCKIEVPNESVVDFCERCGKSVWGEKMFATIVSNITEAQKRGDIDPVRGLWSEKTVKKDDDFF